MLLAPAAAWAAEQAVRNIEQDINANLHMFVVVAAIVQILWIMGYCASSLPKWAKWEDGSKFEKYEIISGMFGSACGGNIIYFSGLYGADMKQIYCFIGAIVGGFLGDKVLNMIADRYVNSSGPKN